MYPVLYGKVVERKSLKSTQDVLNLILDLCIAHPKGEGWIFKMD